jgi:SSS family solute:Na+ symporter
MAEGKGGYFGRVHEFPSTMAQNFWIAIFAWTTCFVVTVAVSLASKPKAESELRSLVYGLTEILHEKGVPWFRRPAPLALLAAGLCVLLNFVYF